MSDRLLGPEDFGGRALDDGFGNLFLMCDRVNCGLEIVRPGKVQCWCDDPFFLADEPPVADAA